MDPRASNRVRSLEQTSTSQASSPIAINQPATSAAQSVPNQPAASPRQSPMPDQQSDSDSPMLEATSNPRRQHHRRRNSQRDPKPIFGADVEERRSSRPSARRIWPQSKLRGFTDVHKARLVCSFCHLQIQKPLILLQAAVRQLMNSLMSMENDRDVVKVDSATKKEIEEFEEGTGAAPELDPMRPFLQSSKQNSWNDTLCEMFIGHLEEEEDFFLTTEEESVVEKMFLDRLGRLSRIWTEARKFSNSQVFEKSKASNQLARRNTRRVDVGQHPNSSHFGADGSSCTTPDWRYATAT